MRIVTSQRIDVVKQLIEDGVYVVTNSMIPNFYRQCYDILIEELEKRNQHFKIVNYATWGWYKRENGLYPHISDTVLVLDVPDKFVVLSSYYDWSDFMFFTRDEPDKEQAKKSFEHVFDVLDDDVQALIPFIRKEWVKEAYYTDFNAEDDVNIYIDDLQNLRKINLK